MANSGNVRGERTRESLIEAAWRIVENVGLGELTLLLPAPRVAEEAGVTVGAVRHHFRTPNDLLDEMLSAHFAELEHLSDYRFEACQALAEYPPTERLRRLIPMLFGAVDRNDFRLQRRTKALLGRFNSRDKNDVALGGFVEEKWWNSSRLLLRDVVEAILDAAEREPLPPFDSDVLTEAVLMLLWGASRRGWIAPNSGVPPVHELSIMVLYACSRAAGDAVSALDRTAALEGESDSDALHAESAVALARAVADGVSGPASTLGFGGLAEAGGVSAADLRTVFGTVNCLVACTFVVALEEVHETLARGCPDPMRGLVDVLCVVTRVARAHEHSALALMAERSGAGSAPELIRRTVPLDRLVAVAMTRAGLDDGNVLSVASELADVCLFFAMSRSRWSPADVAERALRMLPHDVQFHREQVETI